MSESSIEESINLGAMGEALNDKMDRDGLNAEINPSLGYGVDYVVEWKVPTDTDPTWYRKYASGWIEQGGLSDVTNASTSAGTFYITLLIAMRDLNYTAFCHYNWETTGDWSGNLSVKQYSTTQLKVSKRTSIQCKTSWEVKGFAA